MSDHPPLISYYWNYTCVALRVAYIHVDALNPCDPSWLCINLVFVLRSLSLTYFCEIKLLLKIQSSLWSARIKEQFPLPLSTNGAFTSLQLNGNYYRLVWLWALRPRGPSAQYTTHLNTPCLDLFSTEIPFETSVVSFWCWTRFLNHMLPSFPQPLACISTGCSKSHLKPHASFSFICLYRPLNWFTHQVVWTKQSNWSNAHSNHADNPS